MRCDRGHFIKTKGTCRICEPETIEVPVVEMMFVLYQLALETGATDLQASRYAANTFWDYLRPGKPFTVRLETQELRVPGNIVAEYLWDNQYLPATPEQAHDWIMEDQSEMMRNWDVESLTDPPKNAFLLTQFGKYIIDGDDFAAWVRDFTK